MRQGLCFVLSAMFAIAVGLTILPGADSARAQGSSNDCPFSIGGANARECYCSAQAATQGSVWGTDVYTADSGMCRAAVHAGVIDGQGGVIRVRAAPGQSSYPASTRNGVASSRWTAYDRSFTFEGIDAAPQDATVDACPATPGNMAIGTSLTCNCGVDATGSGSVWGSGPYTTDSSICRSARHAGAIGAGGGTVTIHVVVGRDSYPPSQRNGVEAVAWARYGSSFIVER